MQKEILCCKLSDSEPLEGGLGCDGWAVRAVKQPSTPLPVDLIRCCHMSPPTCWLPHCEPVYSLRQLLKAVMVLYGCVRLERYLTCWVCSAVCHPCKKLPQVLLHAGHTLATCQGIWYSFGWYSFGVVSRVSAFLDGICIATVPCSLCLWKGHASSHESRLFAAVLPGALWFELLLKCSGDFWECLSAATETHAICSPLTGRSCCQSPFPSSVDNCELG